MVYQIVGRDYTNPAYVIELGKMISCVSNARVSVIGGVKSDVFLPQFKGADQVLCVNLKNAVSWMKVSKFY